MKQKPSKHSLNGLLGFITLGIYTPLEARVYLYNNCMSCPCDMGLTLSTFLINILLGSFQLFLHSDQPLSEGEIITVQRCLPVGGRLRYHAGGGGGFTHWLTDCFDVQPTTTSGSIITQSIIFSFSISLTPSCILHRRSNITLTHLHVSNCRVRQLQFSGILFALGFVGNGVITVMINSPWQADDDADNQSGDNRGDSCSYINLSPDVPPTSLVAIRLS